MKALANDGMQRSAAAEPQALAGEIHDLKITTDLPVQELVGLAMPRKSRDRPGSGIHAHGMVGALAQQTASL